MKTHRAAMAITCASMAAAALTCLVQGAQLLWPSLASPTASRMMQAEQPQPSERWSQTDRLSHAAAVAESAHPSQDKLVAVQKRTSWHHNPSYYKLTIGGGSGGGERLRPYCSDDTQLVVVIISAVDHFERRQAIRDTWLRWLNVTTLRVSYAFLLGVSRLAEDNDRVAAEWRSNGDVLQASFVDDYDNLTLKSIAMLRWVRTRCPRDAHLLKVDDDVFLNMPVVDGLLAAATRSGSARRRLTATVVGRILLGSRPETDPTAKWYAGDASEYAAAAEYPPYASGPLYLISSDLVGSLLEQALRLPFLRIEDVFITGVCAAAVGAAGKHSRVIHLHHPAFTDLRLQPSGCHFRNAANGHGYKSFELRRIWADLSADSFVGADVHDGGAGDEPELSVTADC